MQKFLDLYAPSAPGSLMRSLKVSGNGLFRICRRNCELYSVQIVSSGSWGRARVMQADGRVLWFQPSTFTGSFWLSAGAIGGLIAELSGSEVNLTLNWREPDREMV